MCALIDVSDLMIDPDFVDVMAIIHRAPTINALGENTLVETTVNTIGSVQPTTGKTLMRLPDSLRIQSVYTFWVKGQILSDGTKSYPDIISFKGQRYQVQTISDWTNWPNDHGWTEGVAVRQAAAL